MFNWRVRDPEILKCIRIGLTSECLSADLVANRGGGTSVFAKLYTNTWQEDGGPLTTITTRQISAIFGEHEDGYALAEACPAIGCSFLVTDCRAD